MGDVKTIKSGKISALGTDISDKNSIGYTYACIEKALIGKILSNTDINDGSHSHYCNGEYHGFDYELDQWGDERLFQTSDEVIIRKLKINVKYRGKLNIKNKSQLSRTMFLGKYGSLDLYDEDLKKIFIIDHEELQLDKNSSWT